MTNEMLLKKIGKICKQFRENRNIILLKVAKDTGYDISTISKFESGANDNLRIFLWYIINGLSVADIYERINDHE